MPVPVAPMKITSQSCGWSKIIPQQGDVLFVPKQCERCGSEQLTHTKARVLDRIKLQFFNYLKIVKNRVGESQHLSEPLGAMEKKR